MSDAPPEAPRDKDPTQRILAYTVTAGFFAVLFCLMFVEVSPDTREPLLIMLGLLGTAFGTVVNYNFGSSAGSKAKDQAKDRAMEQMTK